MLCTDLTGVKHYDDHIEATPLWCNSWQCSLCNPRRKTKLIAQVLDGTPTVLLTLTVAPEVPGTQPERAQALAHAWRELRRLIRIELALPTRLRWLDATRLADAPALAADRRQALPAARKAPAPLPFFAVFERTVAGAPHLHIALRPPFLPQAWLSAQMQRILKSPIVDIRQVQQTRGLARYLGKYIGKDAHKFGTCKRYWSSADYSLTKDDHAPATEPGYSHFSIERTPWHDFVHAQLMRGCYYELQEGTLKLWPKRPRSQKAQPCISAGLSG